MKTILAFLCGILLSVGVYSQNKTTIRGSLMGGDAKVMKLAHIHARQFSSPKDAAQSFAVNNDGSFLFALPNGWYSLEFSGVDHSHTSAPYMVYCCGTEVKLSVKLEPNAIESKVDSVAIILDVDNYNFSKMRMMSASNDGTWSYDVNTAADTVGYQVIVYTAGNEDQHSVNGTQSDRYIYDGGGDYRSVVRTTNGSVRITFDPRAAARAKAESSVEFVDEFSKSVSAVLKEQRDLMSRYFKEYTKHQDGKEYDWNPAAIRKDIAESIQKEQNPQIRQLRMMTYLSVQSFSADTTGADPQLVDQILSSIPPSSVVWGNYSWYVLSAISMSSNPKSDYAERVLRENPIAGLKADILYAQVKEKTELKKEDEAKALYEQLIKEYGDTYTAQRAVKELNPSRKVKVGATIPNFAFEAIEDSTTKITPESVHGRWVLIDNWATWCGPCVGEMGSLHKAYEKFKDKNFTILSVSFDRGKAEIAKFRAGKWPMPWLHCFSPGVWQNEATKIFEVTGIPKPILIDPNGLIVSIGTELRGANLETVLAKYVK